MPATIKVAVVHFQPKLGDTERNLQRILQLTEEAARAGAKIVVHTEMATSGYSFFSRSQIRRVAETVPGPTTEALGSVARKHGIYLVVGLPEIDPSANRFYNTATLIGPDGRLVGSYRKRSHLLESSWASIGAGPVPVFDTLYGKVSIVICADLFYSEIPRMAAVAGAKILIVPANVGIEEEFLRLRAVENGLALIVANRYGAEGKASKPSVFDQETLTIVSPFPYVFDSGTRSVIMNPDGRVLISIEQKSDIIGYGELQPRRLVGYPVKRRPRLYSMLGQDTLEPYTFSQLGLPRPGRFAVAAVDAPPDGDDALAGMAATARRVIQRAQTENKVLKLISYPAGMLIDEESRPLDTQRVLQLASELQVDLVVGVTEKKTGGKIYSTSLFAGKDKQLVRYRRVHAAAGERIDVGDQFVVIDREYARIGLLQGEDMLAPESSRVLAKLGVDMVVVSADTSVQAVPSLWQLRTWDYLHIVVANRRGPEGIYLGGYLSTPDHVEQEGQALMEIDTELVRKKKEPRNLDGIEVLLAPEGNDR